MTLEPAARSARPMEKSTALPRPPPASTTVSPRGISVGVPVGPISTTGSPGRREARDRGAQHDFDDARCEAAHLVHHRAQVAVEPREELRVLDGQGGGLLGKNPA